MVGVAPQNRADRPIHRSQRSQEKNDTNHPIEHTDPTGPR